MQPVILYNSAKDLNKNKLYKMIVYVKCPHEK